MNDRLSNLIAPVWAAFVLSEDPGQLHQPRIFRSASDPEVHCDQLSHCDDSVKQIDDSQHVAA